MSIFSSIGNIFKSAASFVLPALGTAIAGPVGGAIGGVLGASFAPKPSAFAQALPAPVFPGAGATQARFGVPAIRLPGANLPALRVPMIPIPGQPPGASTGTLMTATGCPPGFHPNKQPGRFGAARTYCVRNRRMNFMNPRAAKRAIRRIKSARKTLQSIERQLPKARSTRRVPHHHHPRP